MEIRCTTCGKEVIPLELYDGNRSCPNCRSSLADYQSKFILTKENEELFLQAELLYANWLFKLDGKTDISSVDKSVQLCRRSARLGNPKALARLAYFYDKDYTARNSSELTRCRVAYEYYSKVCYSDLNNTETEAGVSSVDWVAVREQTAYSMLYMLASAPAEMQNNPTYSLQNNLTRVRQELPGVMPDFTGFSMENYKLSMVDRIFAVFQNCMNKKRAPLFGAFRMKVSELVELYLKATPERENMLIWLTTQKKVWLSYIREADLPNREKLFERLSTERTINGFREWSRENGANEDELIWVYFFNPNGGHPYINMKKQKKVQKTMYGNNGTGLLRTMLQNGRHNFYTFYDDDIYHFMRKNNEVEAVKALVDRVCGGGEER